MSLRKRTLIITLAVAAGLILVAYFVLAAVLMAGFTRLETKDMNDNIHRTRNSLGRELAALGGAVSDWAYWDDTYQYIVDQNSQYLEANLMEATFTNLAVNFIIFADTDGRIVYAQGYDLVQATEVPIPDLLGHHLITDNCVLANAAFKDGTEGLLVMPEGALLVAARPILTSNNEGPARGALIFGRFLDDSFVDRMADTTLTDVSVFRVDEDLPADVARAETSLAQGAEVFVNPLDRGRVAGYTLLKDLDDQPAIILKLESPRLVVQQGRRSIRFAMAALVLTVALSTAATWMLLERTVVSRVTTLAAQVRDIGLSADPAQRVSLSGGDELAELATDINHMLDSLHHERETNRMGQERQEILSRIISDYTYIAQVDNNNQVEINWCSPELANMFGAASPQELLPALKIALEKDDLPAAIAHRDTLVQGQEHIAVLRIHDPAGQERWLRSYGHPVEDLETGHVVRIYGAVQDITDQRQAEEDRQILDDLYAQAQKMETVGRLTAGIAHDFNNILTVINGFAELLQYELPADSPHMQLVGRIADSGSRAAELVRQLMAFSRKQASEAQVIDMNAQIVSIQPMLQRVIGEDVVLETQLALDLWPTRADPIHIEQVILNLASNARDAMPRGGQLAIHTSNVGTTSPTQPHLKPGQYVLLTVRDTGMGMSHQLQSKVFEPFFTTKERGKGTGLGLATVYNIVEQAEGFVWLSSEENLGTTVEIYWPRADILPPSCPAVDREGTDGTTGTETVLVAEDDDAVRAAAQRMLENYGYAVHTAYDGPSAIEIFESRPDEIDIVVTDLVMPGLGGRAMMDHLRHIRPDLKVVFMTGYQQRAIEELKEAYPNAILLAKPFSTRTLARAVRDALDAKPA